MHPQPGPADRAVRRPAAGRHDRVHEDGREQLPRRRIPGGDVDVSQPGAAPSEMETQITQRVEAAIRSVENVEEINSSLREGFSETQVSFQIGTPLDRATDDVRTAIAQIRSDLPDGILEPQVQRMRDQ